MCNQVNRIVLGEQRQVYATRAGNILIFDGNESIEIKNGRLLLLQVDTALQNKKYDAPKGPKNWEAAFTHENE